MYTVYCLIHGRKEKIKQKDKEYKCRPSAVLGGFCRATPPPQCLCKIRGSIIALKVLEVGREGQLLQRIREGLKPLSEVTEYVSSPTKTGHGQAAHTSALSANVGDFNLQDRHKTRTPCPISIHNGQIRKRRENVRRHGYYLPSPGSFPPN